MYVCSMYIEVSDIFKWLQDIAHTNFNRFYLLFSYKQETRHLFLFVFKCLQLLLLYSVLLQLCLGICGAEKGVHLCRNLLNSRLLQLEKLMIFSFLKI